VVTKPEHAGQSRKALPPNPLRTLAAEHGTPTFDPENVNDAAARDHLAALQADLLVVCDYGRILSSEMLATARLGGVNLHGSLLPRYRGAAPVAWAIYHGETETGVTVIHMDPRLDAGPILAQARTPIGPDETTPELETRLAELGAPLVCRAVDDLAAGTARPLPQDVTQATRAPRFKKSDGEVDWSRSAAAIRNQIRALEPWPRTSSCWLRNEGAPLRLILCRAQVVPAAEAAALGTASPGTVVADGSRLWIATGDGVLAIEQVQPAGKRAMPVAEFLRGHAVRIGQQFGPASES
jgi:methionyl-tRNA formyltransferase